MIMRAGLVLAVAVSLAGCSGAGGAVLGSWKCEASSAGQRMAGDMNYGSDGKVSGIMTLTMSEAGGQAELQVSIIGKWKLRGDQLEEEVEDLSIMSATVNGSPVPTDAMAPMVAGMKGQATTSTVVASDNLLVLKNGDLVTTCSK